MSTKKGNINPNNTGLIEGGGEFIDYRDPKKVFKTKSIVEWDKHLKETNATVDGSGICAICNTAVVEFKGLKYGTKPICDSCKKDIGVKK